MQKCAKKDPETDGIDHNCSIGCIHCHSSSHDASQLYLRIDLPRIHTPQKK